MICGPHLPSGHPKYPEYATPECDSVYDLVTHDEAAERILEGLLVDAERRLREGIAGDVYLFKNNKDMVGGASCRARLCGLSL